MKYNFFVYPSFELTKVHVWREIPKGTAPEEYSKRLSELVSRAINPKIA